MKLLTGMHVSIHSYKHNKKLHRIWRKAIVLTQTNELLVTGNEHTQVIEYDGRSWHTKEPAICYFFNDSWFNVIAMLRVDGVHFYCNIASPYLYDGEAVKYIDYDLDIRVLPDGSFQLLDEREYFNHQKAMRYSKDIQNIIEDQKNKLIHKIKHKEYPFSGLDIMTYYDQFKLLKNR